MKLTFQRGYVAGVNDERLNNKALKCDKRESLNVQQLELANE